MNCSEQKIGTLWHMHRHPHPSDLHVGSAEISKLTCKSCGHDRHV